MSKIRNLKGGGLTFFCPGCDQCHSVNTSARVTWDYNGDADNPTLSPSILVRMPRPGHQDVCHSYVRNGAIEFLNDCTHVLAGRTVPLPEWPYAPGSYGGVDG